MTNVYLPGQKKSALCPECKGRVEATFHYDTYCHPDGITVANVLMLFCDCCGAQLAHAHQSSYLIQRARAVPKPRKTSVRIPQVLLDLASSKIHSMGGDPKKVCAPEMVVKATLATTFEKSQPERVAFARRMKSCQESPLWGQKQSTQVPLKLSDAARQELLWLVREAHFQGQSEAVRASILLAVEDDSPINAELRKLVMLY